MDAIRFIFGFIHELLQVLWHIAFVVCWAFAGNEIGGPWVAAAAMMTAMELWDRWHPDRPTPTDGEA